MFCPNCGSKNSTQQKFCRSCGLSLEKTAQSLVEQIPTKIDKSLERRKEKLERFGVIALSGVGVVGVGALSYMIIFNMMLAQGKILGGLALLTIIICGLLAVFFFNYANYLKETAVKNRLQPPEEMPESETPAKLPNDSYLEPIPSVTERTTELLYVEKKKDNKAT
jgi:zinc-ribbon domain